jgi:hypothetical protein
MRRTARILAFAAGVMTIGIGLYLLIAQPHIGKHWATVWWYEMGGLKPFHIDDAATVLGSAGLVLGIVVLFAGWLIGTHAVAAGVIVILVDMLACAIIAVCPDPRTGVLIWAVPGLLLAATGFLLGMELQHTLKPDGVAQLR